jgi:succinoglycan biosynthesis protein ExoV
MKLRYHTGQNFGDALNPMILDEVFKGLLNDSDEVELLGIGSILGLKRPSESCRKFVVFSSGYAAGDSSTYGELPEITDIYDVICVRGPLTASILGLSADLAISDGALLLPDVIPLDEVPKEYEYSYMPHAGSLNMYDGWQELVESVGIHFIDPRQEPVVVFSELMKTELLLTEAMHGAIVSDTLRIPWIPVKTAKTVNEFKWKDYLHSVNLEYNPNVLPCLYSKTFLKSIFAGKLGRVKLGFLTDLAVLLYWIIQCGRVWLVKKSFNRLKRAKCYMCEENILQLRKKQLMAAAQQWIQNYKNIK